jgi:hypothetical protein
LFDLNKISLVLLGVKMTKQHTEVLENEEVELLREHLSPDEIFLLGFLKGFDRRVTQEWEDEGLLDISLEYE